LCLKLIIENTKVLLWFVSLRLFYTENTRFSLYFFNIFGVIPLFCQIYDESMRHLRYWVHSFELGLHSTWLREYRVPGFENTGYMVSDVLGYRVRGT